MAQYDPGVKRLVRAICTECKWRETGTEHRTANRGLGHSRRFWHNVILHVYGYDHTEDVHGGAVVILGQAEVPF